MGKITLDITANAADLLNGTDEGIAGIKELAAQGKVTKESLKRDFAEAGKSTKEFNNAIDGTVKSLVNEGKTVEALILKYGSAAAAQKAMQKELINMAVAGQQGTKEFNELRKAAADLKDTIEDTRGSVNKLASDTSTFDKIAEGGRAMAAGFSVAAGAASLFGDENENLQRSVQKAQGAMSLLLGVQELAKIATEEGGIATGFATAAQQLYTFAVGTSTGALKVFRLALLGTGIGALILLLYAAADAFGFFDSKIDETTDKAKENKKAIDELSDSYDNLGRKTVDTDGVIARIKKGFDLSTISTKELKSALNELQESLDNVQSEKKILGFPGSQFFKDSSEAAKAETKELRDNIEAIKQEIALRGELKKAVTTPLVSALSSIDKKVLDENINQIVDAFGKASIGIPEQVKLLRALGFNDTAIFKALSEAADKMAKDGSGIVKLPVEPLFIAPKELPNIEVLGFKIPVKLDITQEEADKISSAINQIADNVFKTLNTAFDAAIQTQQKFIDTLDDRIEKQKDVVAAEQKLANEGKANNLAIEVAGLEKLNKARESALEKQKKIKNAQVALDTISQLSSLITASAKIYESLANIPVVGVPLATALVATMFAAFAASKVAGAVLTSQSGFREGGYTGDGDPSEVSTAQGNRGYKYHKKEFVMNEQLTAEHRDFFEALHNDDKVGILFGIADLLKGTGVVLPDENLPLKLKTAKDEHRRIEGEESNYELAALRKELVEIKEEVKGWRKQPKESTTSFGDKLIIKKGNKTTVVTK